MTGKGFIEVTTETEYTYLVNIDHIQCICEVCGKVYITITNNPFELLVIESYEQIKKN